MKTCKQLEEKKEAVWNWEGRKVNAPNAAHQPPPLVTCCMLRAALIASSIITFHLFSVFLPIMSKIHFSFAEFSSKLFSVINYGFSEIFSIACGKKTLIWFNSR